MFQPSTSSNAEMESSLTPVDSCKDSCCGKDDVDVDPEECCSDCESDRASAKSEVEDNCYPKDNEAIGLDSCGLEKKGGCCDDDNCEGEKKADCCSGSVSSCEAADINDDSEEQGLDKDMVDYDSACKCCLQVLVNEPSPRDSNSNLVLLSDVADVAIESCTRRLRACCRILERYCVRRPCCFVPLPVTQTSRLSKYNPKESKDLQSKDTKIPAAVDTLKDIKGSEKLRLEVRGMDCVDCTTKVIRALTQLPSVHNASVDYFAGIAQLSYNPEIITPAAVAAYVGRATGFGVRPLSGLSGDDAIAVITLPFFFANIPLPEALDGFDTHVGSNPHIILVSFSMDQDANSQRPRDILERFKLIGGELMPGGPGGKRDNATRDFIKVGTRTLVCAVLSIPVLVLAWADLPPRPILYGSISVAFTTLIQAQAFSILSSAVRAVIFLHQVDLSVLVGISTLTAYLFSVIAFAFEAAGKPFSSPFFETSALLITLILLGRTISAATRRSTGSALRELERLQPNDVLLISDADPEQPARKMDARVLFYGDIIRIFPDTRVATDGIVVSGSSDIDESSITGESVAVTKQKGNHVIAGTLNLSGTIDVQVTRLIHENSLSCVTTLVKQAQSSRSPVQDLADRLSALILPVAAISACIAFLIWALVGSYVRHLSATASSIQALTYLIAVLVVSCPCAIGLAVPLVISCAIRIGLKEGVLFRSNDALQAAHDINTIVFDKTGTLSQGDFTVEHVEILVPGAEHLIMTLIEDNKHPISQGVYRYLANSHSPTATAPSQKISDILSLPGKGISASLHGFPFLGGNPSFTNSCNHPIALELQSSGLTLFSVTLAGQPVAFFGLADTPRPDAHALVAELVRRGKQVMIMSGDTLSAVHRLAKAVGVPTESAFAACTPEDKGASIMALQAKGQRVCFIGDGTNDAPALSRADVAVAIAAGSDVAVGAAGVVLMHHADFKKGVLAVLNIASASRKHCEWALAWCVLYNVFAILLASGAFVKVRIEPRWAGIGELVSVLPVVAIGFLLDLRWRWARW